MSRYMRALTTRIGDCHTLYIFFGCLLNINLPKPEIQDVKGYLAI